MSKEALLNINPKGILIFLAFFITGCANKVVVPKEKIILENQQHSFILGTSELNIIIYKSFYYPYRRSYKVYGYVEDVIHNNNFDMRVPIYKLKNGDSILIGTTGKLGKFKLNISPNDTILFKGEQYKYLYVNFSTKN